MVSHRPPPSTCLFSCRTLLSSSLPRRIPPQLLNDSVHSFHIPRINRPLGRHPLGQHPQRRIQTWLEVSNLARQRIDGLSPDGLTGVFDGEKGEDGYRVQSQEFRLGFDVVLHGGADAPRRVPPQLGFVAPQLLDQGRPETQDVHVVRIVEVLDQLFEIVKGGQLVREPDVGGLDGGHGLFHQVGVRGTAEEGVEGVGVEGAGGGGSLGFGVGGGGWVGGGGFGVFDAPFQELVHAWVHDGVVQEEYLM